jgi:hypothetical protein
VLVTHPNAAWYPAHGTAVGTHNAQLSVLQVRHALQTAPPKHPSLPLHQLHGNRPSTMNIRCKVLCHPIPLLVTHIQSLGTCCCQSPTKLIKSCCSCIIKLRAVVHDSIDLWPTSWALLSGWFAESPAITCTSPWHGGAWLVQGICPLWLDKTLTHHRQLCQQPGFMSQHLNGEQTLEARYSQRATSLLALPAS